MEWFRRAATKTSRSPLNHFHHSTAFGWTIWYPAHWRVEVSKIENGEIVRITDVPPGNGVVYVNAHIDGIKDQDDFLERFLASRIVMGWDLIERRQQSLSDGTSATVLFEEQPSPEGVKSLIVMVIKSDRVIWVTAETFKALWPEYETTLRGMVSSFSLR